MAVLWPPRMKRLVTAPRRPVSTTSAPGTSRSRSATAGNCRSTRSPPGEHRRRNAGLFDRRRSTGRRNHYALAQSREFEGNARLVPGLERGASCFEPAARNRGLTRRMSSRVKRPSASVTERVRRTQPLRWAPAARMGRQPHPGPLMDWKAAAAPPAGTGKRFGSSNVLPRKRRLDSGLAGPHARNRSPDSRPAAVRTVFPPFGSDRPGHGAPLTVAGQWRIFTAFPSIPGVSVCFQESRPRFSAAESEYSMQVRRGGSEMGITRNANVSSLVSGGFRPAAEVRWPPVRTRIITDPSAGVSDPHHLL